MVTRHCRSNSQSGKKTSLHVDVLHIPVERDTTQVSSKLSSGNLNVSNGNTSMVTQDLLTKVIISECFLIAAMERTYKIGRTYISAKGLSMDIIGRRNCEKIVVISSLAISVVNFLMFRRQ